VRRRLLVVSLSLVGVLMVALMAPLVTTYASDRTQDLFVGRLGDVTRFAVLAEDALESGEATGLQADLERYVDVYGGAVLVTNANREVVARAGDLVLGDPEESAVLDRALSGAGSQPPGTVWPWGDDDVVIGSPVGRDAQVLGAVLMVAPTAPVQASVSRGLSWLTVAGLAIVLVTAYGLIVPLVGWILRPVRDLDHAAEELASGDLSSRAHETGPPELRHLARTFNAMADNVETSQRQQRELVADAAHQLGNPLTALRLRVENLASAAGRRKAVDPVLEETDRLSEIVDSLLRLSQVGARRVAPAVVDVAALVRHRCEMWEPVFERLDVEAPAAAPALATPDLVDVALDAFLDNAAKFAPGSPVTVRVEQLPDGGVRLSVRDRGRGLHPEDAAKVGSRFFRGREHQNVPGTGLGLAIVRARLEDEGGSLAVSAPEDGGLRVEVTLPASPAAPGSSAPHPDGAAGAS
jgi:signal transduction histidine kinase